MSKKSGEPKKVVNLADFRDEKKALNIKIGGYYAHPELGVHLHCIGITEPMHTKGNTVHFVIEDHFGNLATFQTTDAPHGFVYSNKDEFVYALMQVAKDAEENIEDAGPKVS